MAGSRHRHGDVLGQRVFEKPSENYIFPLIRLSIKWIMAI